jgi:hypothetical protein
VIISKLKPGYARATLKNDIMKKYLLPLLLLIFLQANAQMWKAVKGEVTFYSYAPLEDIKATSNQVNSFITFDKKEAVFIIPMRSFHFAKSLMEEHFNEKYIESDKYPNTTYKGIINEDVNPANPGTYHLTSKGTMNIHGVEKEVNEPAVMEIQPDTITLETDFHVAIADYKITVPQLLLHNIADTVDVKMKAWYVRYKK